MPALIIVFREVIEAGLIVGIVLAATTGVPHRGCGWRWAWAAGVLGACLVAAFAGELASLFQGSGQELFNAADPAARGVHAHLAQCLDGQPWPRDGARNEGRRPRGEDRRAHAGGAGRRGRRGGAARRLGSRAVSLWHRAPRAARQPAAMVAGGALGLLAGAAVSALMYFGLAGHSGGQAVPGHGGLITLLAAGMAAQAVTFQQAAIWSTLRRRCGTRPGCSRKTASPDGCCIPWSATQSSPMARS